MPNSRANPFAHMTNEDLRASREAHEAQRARLRVQGPRPVTTLENSRVRALTSFGPYWQAEFSAMIANGDIEALLFEDVIYIPLAEVEHLAGPGYDLDDWLQASDQPTNVDELRASLDNLRIR